MPAPRAETDQDGEKNVEEDDEDEEHEGDVEDDCHLAVHVRHRCVAVEPGSEHPAI